MHDASGVFVGLPSPIFATRYHSLVIDPASLPPTLRATAWADDGEIMAVVHREHPVVGVQFHPESALTEHGYRLLDRFLAGDAARGDALPDRADLARAKDRTNPAHTMAPAIDTTPPPVELVR
jgi:hypothetical protein